MSKLVDFLDALGSDADFRERYKADPETVMIDFGLDEAERSAILDADIDAVKKLSGLDADLKIIVGILSYKPTK